MHIKEVYGSPLFSLSALPDRGTKSVMDPPQRGLECLPPGRSSQRGGLLLAFVYVFIEAPPG